MYSERLESHLSVQSIIKHGEELKWIFQEPSEASVKNRSDRSLSGAIQNLFFGREERTNLEHSHAANLSYQRELLELHDLLHISPYL